ncbi:MAG: hypothetical protein KIS78_16340 [Labilithrix sp.]|nr:hypothetical protein [Labilithrix sp.]
MRHFSTWDCNWGFGPPIGAGPPPPPGPGDGDIDDPFLQCGSIIGCESRTLGESLPIVGTPFHLSYQSSRSAGYKSRIQFEIADASPPPSVERVRIEVEIAGRHETFERPAPVVPNDVFVWTWDGRDGYGRDVGAGKFDAKIRVGYEYAGTTTRSTASFASMPSAPITGDRAMRTVTFWREATYAVARGVTPSSLGGWTLDAHHFADLEALTLYQGDGRRRRLGTEVVHTVDSVAGGGPSLSYNDGGQATQAYLGTIEDIARAPDGTLYLATEGNTTVYGRIRRVGPDGIITTLAGAPPTSPKVDGGPALHAAVWPTSIVVGADGAIYFAEYPKHQVWKIVPGPTPTLHLVAGHGLPPPNSAACPPPANDCGDGRDAREADLRNIRNIALATDGTLFIADGGHYRVRRVGPEGRISTYAERQHDAIALRSDGTLFVKEGERLRRVDPSGESDFVREASTGLPSSLNADWCQHPHAFGGEVIALDDDAFLLTCGGKLLWRSPQGSLLRIAGKPADSGYAGDGGPALHALFAQTRPLVIGENQELFVADNGAKRIRRVRPSPLAALSGSVFRIPSEDGAEIYEVDLGGRHLRTLSGLRGTALYTFGYDPSSGRLTTVHDADGNETRIAYASGSVAITAPHGQVTTLALDSNGHLASVTGPVLSEVTALAHDESGLLTDLIDVRGQPHHFDYGVDGRLARDVDATPASLGKRLAMTGDSLHWDVAVTSPEGRVTSYGVERGGAFGDAAIVERRTVTHGPGETNPLTTIVDRSGDGTKNSVSPDGTKVTALSSAADPRWGTTASFVASERTDIGHPVTTHSMTRTEARTATLAVPGDPFSVTAQTITTTLSGAGLPTATTTRVYAAGPPATWTTTSPAGRQTRETLDTLERVTEVAVLGSDPVALHPIQYRYDERGRVDQVTRGARVYATSYDPLTGWVASTSDPAGLGVTYTSRDGNGRPLGIALPGGRALAMSYDPSGNVLSVTPPSQPAHAFSWDPASRPSAYAPPDLGFTPKDTTYAHDHDGLLLSLAQPGTPATFAYDAFGRLHQSVDAVTKSYAYDAQGRLASITTSDDVTLTNAYDGSLLAQQAVSGPFSHALNKTHDDFLRVSSWNIDGVSPVARSYDGDSLVTATGGMTLSWGTTGLLKTTAVGALTDAFTYNAHGELVGHTVTGSATSYAATYTRDAAGRLDTKTETLGGTSRSERYTYDDAGRLGQVFVDGASTPTHEYAYDPNGNRDDGTHDAQDRLLTHGGVSFAYGANGELAKKTDGVTLAETLYAYDTHGSLRAVTRPAPLAPIEYVIDGNNRRIGKKVGGSLVQGFLYDGARVVAELDAAGAVVARFVYATDGHAPDLMLKGGATYRFVKDHLGSPRLVVDAATGAVAQRIDLDPWGVVTLDSNPGFQPFGFAGGLWDHDTGFVRFGARDYDPATGRWTTKDSIRFAGGLNLYGYVNNDPINAIDPDGRAPRDILFFHWFEWLVGRDRDRNLNNRCPPRIPKECPNGRDWTRSTPLSRTWRGSDGSECTYDRNGDLQLGGESFNYGANPWSLRHIVYDFLPGASAELTGGRAGKSEQTQVCGCK